MNVCFESNIIDVSSDTWWLDSGVTIHACNSMQAVISRRNPTSLEQYIYMGDGTRVQIYILGVVRLQLSIENILELRDVAYIPSIRRNLISIPIWRMILVQAKGQKKLCSKNISFLFLCLLIPL